MVDICGGWVIMDSRQPSEREHRDHLGPPATPRFGGFLLYQGQTRKTFRPFGHGHVLS